MRNDVSKVWNVPIKFFRKYDRISEIFYQLGKLEDLNPRRFGHIVNITSPKQFIDKEYIRDKKIKIELLKYFRKGE